MRHIVLYLLVGCVLMLSACTKVPKKVEFPTAVVGIELKDTYELYSFRLKGAIENENSDVALVDFKATIYFIDPGAKGVPVGSIPVEIPIILPFEKANIDLEQKGKDTAMLPIIGLVGINKEELSSQMPTTYKIDERYIVIGDVSFKKRNIMDILREKADEKNK